MLRVIDTGIASAQENMERDERFLASLDPGGDPILHLYRFVAPALTFGYFVSPREHLDFGMVEKYRFDVARRPTGGGIVFHIWDLAFSFLLPARHPHFSQKPLENYRFVNGVVSEAMKEFFVLGQCELIARSLPPLGPHCRHFCMARPTQYDVLYRGRKIAGAAQRKRRQGVLHQGTISLAFPHVELLTDVLAAREEVVSSMVQFTFAPLGRIWEAVKLNAARKEIEQILEQKFIAQL